MLADYYIGNLNQNVKATQNKTATATKTPAKTNTVTQIKPVPIATPILPAQTIPNPTPIISNTTQNTTLALNSAELAKHNSSQSCWLLISEKIYDVTTYINSHPGGATEILNSCGTDATVAFNTRGGTGSHSSSAVAMLASYYIGDLNQTVTTSPSNPTIVNPSAATTNTSSGSGRHDDDDD